MLANYIKIAWRNLRRHKGYAIINVLGLSLGLACAILIFALIHFQTSFDNFHPDKDRIYRIVSELHDETIEYSPAVPAPLGKAFRNDFTLSELTTRIVTDHDALISLPSEKEVKKFHEERNVAFAEPAFFDIFHFPLVQGDPKTALANPHSAIITESIAHKYFGNDPAMGKRIRMDNHTDFIITGILKDIPANTDRKQNIYLSFDQLKDTYPNLAGDSTWLDVYSGSQCYIRLRPSVTIDQADQALRQLSKKYYSAKNAKIFHFLLQPLADIHFNKDYDGDMDKRYLWALGCIGLFLIVTACVNFVNLATAQALNRSKEVGVRKVLGSLRGQLFWQFITETACITAFALLLAIGIAFLVRPWLDQLLHNQMPPQLFYSESLFLFLPLLGALVVLLAGAYPGFVLTKFQPALALKNKLSQAHIGGFSLRRVLVVTQFTISQALILSALVIGGQVYFSKNIDMGFNKEGIVTLPIPTPDDKIKANRLKNELEALPGVEQISLCMQPPASSMNSNTVVRLDGRTEDERWSLNTKSADAQYLSTFGVQLVAGRNFAPSDTTRELLVNETLVRKLQAGSPEQLLGKILLVDGGRIKAPIVGVVKDFHLYSLHHDIDPVAIFPDYTDYRTCAVKINLANTHQSLASFERIWNSIYPEYLYSYRFLDERIAEFYETEQTMLSMVLCFAAIAIFIGCLGLYGLVSFMALQKTKEIGVRKVLGAGFGQIIWIFGREFTLLLTLSFLIAAPISGYLMHNYLENFKYRIHMGAGIFITAILFTFLIAAFSVGYRSLRAAIANPVKSLRSE